MPSSRPTRFTAKHRIPAALDKQLDRKLFAYAAVASAAGASILAMSQPSEAEIVFTPTHQMVPRGGRLALDLYSNNDGVTDFTFRNVISSCGFQPGHLECSDFTRQVASVYGNSALNGVGAVGSRSASALPAGKRVGPAGKFLNFAWMEDCSTQNGFSEGSGGPWLNVQNRYLGLAFTIAGHVHYGWARLTVTVTKGKCIPETVVLTGYAYETVAGKPIATGARSGTASKISAIHPAHATLGALAQGHIGPNAWRREEDQVSAGV